MDMTKFAGGDGQYLKAADLKGRTRMDMTKFAGGDGQYLKAADLKGRTREITIKQIGVQAFEKEDGHTDEKPILWLETKDEQERGVAHQQDEHQGLRGCLGR